jgi:hypothetical protein
MTDEGAKSWPPSGWYPASGYMTESKKPKWRIVKTHPTEPHRHIEHLTRAGNIWICDTREQAKEKADAMNLVDA